jgi:pimeloyl-ACP methyl ester carboxylesterase
MFLKAFFLALGLIVLGAPIEAAEEPPMSLARDGFFYVGGKLTTVDGKQFVTGQMYVEYRIPARKLHSYPIIMVHGGTMSGTNYTGTPDGREGWAQNFVRQGYAVYVVDQVGKGRSSYMEQTYGPTNMADSQNSQSRYISQGKYKLWPQAHLHTQWPGSGEVEDGIVQQLLSSQIPSIRDFTKQQVLNRDALIALVDKLGPSILLVHSQAGTFGWPVADARPDLVKAILAIEPNGPPAYSVEFVGAPDYFKQGRLGLTYGITAVPLTYAPAINDPSELVFVQEEKADGPDMVKCWRQAAPARQLPNLQKIPVLVLTAEASYHAPYDHCTVRYLEQAGLRPSWVKLADLGIRGNSHVMMMEKNSKQIASAIGRWLEKTFPRGKNANRLSAR